MSPSNMLLPVEDFQNKVADEEMFRHQLAVETPKDSDDVEAHEHGIIEPDNSQLLKLQPPLTLSEINSKLTPIERVWLADVVKAHSIERVLAQWPVFEVHINYVRYLLKLQ
ncbi:MAG: hypothetical protein QM706_07765 [Nitrospira sp.]